MKLIDSARPSAIDLQPFIDAVNAVPDDPVEEDDVEEATPPETVSTAATTSPQPDDYATEHSAVGGTQPEAVSHVEDAFGAGLDVQRPGVADSGVAVPGDSAELNAGPSEEKTTSGESSGDETRPGRQKNSSGRPPRSRGRRRRDRGRAKEQPQGARDAAESNAQVAASQPTIAAEGDEKTTSDSESSLKPGSDEKVSKPRSRNRRRGRRRRGRSQRDGGTAPPEAT